MKFTDRIKSAYSAFQGKTIETEDYSNFADIGFNSRPSYKRYIPQNTSVVIALYSRIASDVAMTEIHHYKIDKINDDREIIEDGIEYCLNESANIDQNSMSFMIDLVFSLLDEGVIAVVPTETTINPKLTASYDINSLRVGKIKGWSPQNIKVECYNEKTGKREDLIISKKHVAIIENPLLEILGASNSTLSRLIKKIGQVDRSDELLSSSRLDIILQLPHSLKTQSRQNEAQERIKSIENQLSNNTHGIAYIDSAEKIIQINRPSNDQIREEVDRLTNKLYNELGLTEKVLNGTADEKEMRLYYSRTIDVILNAIIKEFNRKFLSRDARSKGHEFQVYRDIFKLIPTDQIANIADTLRRNQILTTNEIRKILGYKPSNDPRADELANPNIADVNQINPESDEELDMLNSFDEDLNNLMSQENQNGNS